MQKRKAEGGKKEGLRGLSISDGGKLEPLDLPFMTQN
jgi:hypothetical protein